MGRKGRRGLLYDWNTAIRCGGEYDMKEKKLFFFYFFFFFVNEYRSQTNTKNGRWGFWKNE